MERIGPMEHRQSMVCRSSELHCSYGVCGESMCHLGQGNCRDLVRLMQYQWRTDFRRRAKTVCSRWHDANNPAIHLPFDFRHRYSSSRYVPRNYHSTHHRMHYIPLPQYCGTHTSTPDALVLRLANNTHVIAHTRCKLRGCRNITRQIQYSEFRNSRHRSDDIIGRLRFDLIEFPDMLRTKKNFQTKLQIKQMLLQFRSVYPIRRQ